MVFRERCVYILASDSGVMRKTEMGVCCSVVSVCFVALDRSNKTRRRLWALPYVYVCRASDRELASLNMRAPGQFGNRLSLRFHKRCESTEFVRRFYRSFLSGTCDKVIEMGSFSLKWMLEVRGCGTGCGLVQYHLCVEDLGVLLS